MKLNFSEKLRFPEIRKDKWEASIGKLSEREMASLRIRELACFLYITLKFIVLLPLTIGRMAAGLIQLLDELERLHFSPLRSIHKGKDCVIDKQTWLVNGHNITLGDFVKISAFSTIMAGYSSTIRIGTNTIVGPGVTIVAFNHGTKMDGMPIRYQEWDDLKEHSVLLGEDVWIGANAVILPGTVIGDGSIIGAGTVIKGSIPPWTITYSKDGRLKTVRRE